jgi:hypothetical protein
MKTDKKSDNKQAYEREEKINQKLENTGVREGRG